MRSFFEERFDWMAEHTRNWLDVGGDQISITVAGAGEGGTVRLNYAQLNGEFDAMWLAGVPLPLTAVPADGYRFAGWDAWGGALEENGPGRAVSIPEEDGCGAEALFEQE